MSLLAAVTRPFRIQTTRSLPDLHVRSFSGEEGVSKLFRFRILAHTDAYVPTAKLLGQHITFLMELTPRQERRFLAMISSVDELGLDEHGRALYALELVPRLWAMTQTVQARVFEDLDLLGMIDQVFTGTGIRVRAQTRPDEAVRPYCVQYFESDFDFVVRLLEEEGYIYEYEGEGQQPVFRIKYFPSSFQRLGPIPFHEVTGGAEERISSWKKTRVLTATAASARDHFFQAASPALEGAADLAGADEDVPGWEPLEANWSAFIHRYPGQWAHLFDEVALNGGDAAADGYTDCGRHRAWHDLRQVAGSTSASLGASNCPRLMPGSVFELTGHPIWSGEHFIVSVHHKGSQAFDHSTGLAHSFGYENEFTSIPYAATLKFLPPRSTRKPVIHGCQTAIVVGAPGAGEIWTDKYGRVQVQFWWDRESMRSCWIRVATQWAGNRWGIQHIPRVGQEVVVAFLDGDPDRPLIVGSVYNPSQMPPYDLPSYKTQSGIRTHSTTGAVNETESNEICFDDTRHSEEIYIHAQKDRTTEVEHDSSELVGNDRSDAVKRDLTFFTGRDKCERVAGNSDLKVDKDCMNSVGGKLGIHAAEIHLSAGKIVIEGDAISIRTSDKSKEFIHLSKGGGITIESKGERVWVNCGGAESPDDGCFKEPDALKNPFDPPAGGQT